MAANGGSDDEAEGSRRCGLCLRAQRRPLAKAAAVPKQTPWWRRLLPFAPPQESEHRWTPLAERAALARKNALRKHAAAAKAKPVAVPEVRSAVLLEDACSRLEHELLSMHGLGTLSSALEVWQADVVDDACNQLRGTLLDMYAGGELHKALAVVQTETEELVDEASRKLQACLLDLHANYALEPTLEGTQTDTVAVLDDACARLVQCLSDLHDGDALQPALTEACTEAAQEVDSHCAAVQAILCKLAETGGGLEWILEVMKVAPERVDDMALQLQTTLLHLGSTGILQDMIHAQVQEELKVEQACLALQSELCLEFGSGVLWDVLLQHDSRKQAQEECLDDLCLDLLTALEYCYATPGIVEQILEDTIPVEPHLGEITEGDILPDSLYLPGYLGGAMAIGEGTDPRLEPMGQTAPYTFPPDEPGAMLPTRKHQPKRLYMATPKLGRLGVVDIDRLPPPRHRAPRRRGRNGPVKVAPSSQAWQREAWKRPSFDEPDPQIGRFYHVVYQGLSDLLQDLHLVKRGGDARSEGIVITSVSADGPARRAGVAAGFLVGEVRGAASADPVPLEDVLMADRSLLLRPKEQAGLAVDLVCPADQFACHGVATVADVAARVPWHHQSIFLPV
mmetsp:Transcript_11365/g.25363  ORF Transcript_11365/g.25363 Transcript_11365/m.25363 type:complete len:624 (+) Transcript_11365:61-1932(+)